MSGSRLVAVEGGGDWCDASVSYLVVPVGVKMDDIAAAWRSWYDGTYIPQRRAGQHPKFLEFTEFAIEFHGVKYATIGDIEVFREP